MINDDPHIQVFLNGKSATAIVLLQHFIKQFERIGPISLHPAKTMIGISNGYKRIAWITQFGKQFIHVVFPFCEPYENNMCFQKIAQVPGKTVQFNHHFRMCFPEDVNEEVLQFMSLAYGKPTDN